MHVNWRAAESSQISQETDNFNVPMREFVSWRSLVESLAFYRQGRKKIYSPVMCDGITDVGDIQEKWKRFELKKDEH